MSRAFRSLFSYYGGKSKLAHLYPPPRHGLIIEPFCGGASYSLLYRDRDVLINDIDPITAAIWRFLLRPDALDVWHRNVHLPIPAGARISEILPPGCDPGLVDLLRAEANQGTQGSRGVHDQVTKRGEKFFERLLRKMEFFLPQIRHWRLTSVDYREIPNQRATWFIDPPYSNAAGNLYRHPLPPEGFAFLHGWCKAREGQAIVCENEGAVWDEFVPLRRRLGFKSPYQLSNAMEVYCERNN